MGASESVAHRPREKDVTEVGTALGVDFNVLSRRALYKGTLVEFEHGLISPNTNVTDDDLETTVKIALAHFVEGLDYYDRLEIMERDLEKAWPTKPDIFDPTERYVHMPIVIPRAQLDEEDVRALQLCINFDVISPHTLLKGIWVEYEHGWSNARTNVTQNDLSMTALIALAHLAKGLDYYGRLEQMEREMKRLRPKKPRIFLR